MKNPFIPLKKVNTILISNRIDESLKSLLKSLDINLLYTIDNPNLAKPVADHADMSVHPVTDKLFIVDNSVYSYYKNLLDPYGIEVISSSTSLTSKYPMDCLLNVSRIQNYYIHNTVTEPSLESQLKSMGLELIKVNQGYSKCSTLILNCDTIVTSDIGIHKTLIQYNINSNLIPQGNIELKGYNTGFIGGCGGMISPDTLVLSGDPRTYLYGEALFKIILDLGIHIEYVSNRKIVDFGSLIIID